jgi:hypothetical protein
MVDASKDRARHACAMRAWLVLITAALLTAFGLDLAPAAQAAATPFAVGDSAGNIPLQNDRVRVMIRWVPTRSGVVRRLHLRVKLDGSGCERGERGGYADGDGGILEATTYRVGRGGLPAGRALHSVRGRPCDIARSSTIALPLGIGVRRGAEYATVVRNVHGSADSNYFSLNFLYARGGLVGANGRNERRAGAGDAYYGLDPREIVGFSWNGREWKLPGGPYGRNDGRAFVPSYLLEWRDGGFTGQAYYYSGPVYGDVSMSYRTGSRPWRIRQIGAYTSEPGSAQVTLFVDGTRRASAVLSGDGHVRARIGPVVAPAGSVVRVVTRSGGGGLALREMAADSLWSEYLGLGRNYRYFRGDGGRDPVTVFPLPARG